MRRSSPQFRAAVLAPLACVAVLAGCSARPTAPRASLGLLPASLAGAPLANSPAHALQRFQWSMEHRSLAASGTLFSADFRMGCTPGDSAGNHFDQRQGRDDLLTCLGHAFDTGSSAAPRATSIALTWGAPWVEVADPRPGRDPSFHRVLRADVRLRVIAGSEAVDVADVIDFSFVRGDSAVIPADLVGRGVHPDPTTWYIEQQSVEGIATNSAARASTAAVRGLPLGWCEWLQRYAAAP